LVDLGIALEVELGSCAKDVVCKAHNFILIVLSLEEALLRAVVQAFSHAPHRFAQHGLGSSQVFICFKGNIAEKDADIFALQNAIAVEIVPKKKREQ